MARPANSNETEKQQPVRRLAWLDGLRGFAALLVYAIHTEGWTHSMPDYFKIDNAWGYDGEYYLTAFPWLRLFFVGGLFAVSIFFVISGYVVAAAPLRAIYARDSLKLGDILASAFFRRWFRLFILVGATTFVWMSLWHLFGFRTSQVTHPPKKTYLDEMWNWYTQFKNFSFVYNGFPWTDYNDHAWSIALEFRGSVVVWSMLLAFARMTPNVRLICNTVVLWYFLWIVDGWYCALFIMGMILCELDMLNARGQLPKVFNPFRRTRPWIFHALLIIGLYIGGVPGTGESLDVLRKSPGWYLLSFLAPSAAHDPRRFYHFVGAALSVAAIPHLPRVKAFFETRVCQYLGRVSFAFYMVHGPILWSLGDRLFAAVGRVAEHHHEMVPTYINLFPLSGAGPMGLEINFLAPLLILLPTTLWTAHIVTRTMDEPSVKFAKWLYDQVLDTSDLTGPKKIERLV
ncbi:hypothetical protein DV738_g4810, partial [Chaetothyriales sp. CBS 135597]